MPRAAAPSPPKRLQLLDGFVPCPQDFGNLALLGEWGEQNLNDFEPVDSFSAALYGTAAGSDVCNRTLEYIT